MKKSRPLAVKTATARTLDELMDIVADVYQETESAGWWFRGHAYSGWTLVPKVWRYYDDALTERYLTNLFYQRAKLRHSSFPDDKDYAAWLALMQHYGLPTRLLDWSDSLLIAAYFATGYERAMSKVVKKHDAAIWMLEPCRLNEYQGYKPVFPSLNADTLIPLVHAAFKEPSARSGKEPSYKVLAAVPPNHDLRMVMQQGCFTIHADDSPLDKEQGCGAWLRKIVIPSNAVIRIALSLDILGVHLSDVFPDLDHLATHLTNMHPPRTP